MINNTVQVDRQMLNEVKDLIGLFPYFQTAHLLLLKGLHAYEDVKFKNQLTQSAIHVADREVLYYLLNRKEEEHWNEQVKTKTEQLEDLVTENPDHQQVVIEDSKSSADMIAGMDAPDMVLNIDEGENPFEDTVVYLDPSFMLNEQDDLLELDLGTPVNRDTHPADDLPEYQLPEKKPGDKTVQAELIDRFILANPRIGPVTDKSERPVEDISKPFVEDTGGLVTETLAKIYFTQGYYSKAMDIYERLSLKYPEKSSYFATQIEKIREFIK